ncbi:MAG: cytochrome ubiquinol oxidase subunit I [Actinobacteria bacterium]|nr:cytochrome ubiquinol oxidase subunit I [Actinomycetota bacterium]
MPDLPLLLAESSNLLAARNQMALTLGFHIILACLGVAFPAIMLIAEYRGRKHGDEEALLLARRWSKAVAVLFAVGAVSGTVLSFELGLLWPEFMERFGDAFGIAFAIEGLFFFTEAIFIAIYIYGWDRLPGWAHFWSGVPIVIAGLGGAAAVVAANSWMNQPQGFDLDAQGNVTNVSPWEVLTNPAAGYEIPHMIFAAYMVAGFGVASVYAVGMLKGRRDRYHRVGFLIPFTVAAIATPIQLFVGDTAARGIADHQPAKFAAMECVYETGPDQTEYIGGICTDGEVKFGIGIPGLDSFLVGFSTDTVVKGLDQIPDDEEPQALTLLHTSFDVMVGIGTALMLLVLWFAWAWWRRRDLPESVWFLRSSAAAGVASVIALEAGWIVTEVGRQPWIVQGYMKVEDAVTDAQGLWWVFGFTFLLYTVLGAGAVITLRILSRRWREEDAAEPTEPYSPREKGAT